MNNIPGWVNNRELKILTTLAGYVPENGSILEIGCFLGLSTTALYNGKNKSVSLDVVDCFKGFKNPNAINAPFEKLLFSQSNQEVREAYFKARDIAIKDGWHEAFKYCIGQEMYNDITVYPVHSIDFTKSKSYNLMFIDADHDMESAINDIKKCDTDVDLIIGDDFSHLFPGISGAVNLQRKARTLIVFENTKMWALVPKTGYWREIFEKNNLLFI